MERRFYKYIPPHFAPVFLHPVRVDKEYNTHGIYTGLFLKDNKIKSNGIHASLISIGNDIKVNGIYASVISGGNDIKVNGIYVSVISGGNDIKVNGIYANLISINDMLTSLNGLYVNLIKLDYYGISFINTSLKLPILPQVSFTGLTLSPYFWRRGISLAQLSMGKFSMGLINTNKRSGAISLGALNFNVGCKIPISPVIGIKRRERTRFSTCLPI